MIYLIMLFSVTPETVSELIREQKYDAALSVVSDKNLTGCIKILKGNIPEGIEDIRESAAKGNLFSLDLFLLFNLKVEEEELKNYIKKELRIYGDSSFSFISPYIRFLVLPPESLYVSNFSSDSVLYPYIIFKLGMENLEKNPENAEKYFKNLIENYPASIPAVVARNTLTAIKSKIEEKK
jgi:hypothetical protein